MAAAAELRPTLFLVAALATPLRGQCPDGSPPPCSRAERRPAIEPTTVAVRYFENASRDSADTGLADGLTDARFLAVLRRFGFPTP